MKNYTTFSLIAIAIFIFFSCAGNKKDKNNSAQRQLIIHEIESLKQDLPMSIPNTPLTMEEVLIQNDMAIYVISAPQKILKNLLSFDSEEANSDKNIARLLNSVGNESIEKFIEAGFGLKYIYKNSDTGEKLFTIEADCNKLKTVKEGVASGKIVAYTALELFQMEINKIEIPCEIDKSVWITDAYIKGNEVFYIVKLESDITSADLTAEDLRGMKSNVLDGLKQTLLRFNKDELSQSGIKIIYVYKNNNGEEFARIEISANDL